MVLAFFMPLPQRFFHFLRPLLQFITGMEHFNNIATNLLVTALYLALKFNQYMKQLSLLLLLSIFICSCGPTIYKNSNFTTVAAQHKTVAILPADVNIRLRPNEARRFTPEQLAQSEESTGFAMQDRMYGWLLRRSNRRNYTVTFQDVHETNAQLHKAGIKYADLRTKTRTELARILGVDAVLSSNVRMDKPMSEGAAVAVGMVLGVWGNTNRAFTTISINEAKAGDLMWKYQFDAEGTVGSSPDNLVDALMRNASRRFPYNGK